MSLRIALLGACPYPVPQGSQVFMRQNGLALKSRGHQVHLVVYHHGIGQDNSGLTIHRARAVPGAERTAAGPSFAKPFQDLALLLKLRRILHEEKIQLLCAHNYEALLVALASGFRPVLYHAHNAMSDELPHYFNGSRIAAYTGRWLDRTFPRKADCVIVPHQRLAGHLIVRGCDHTRVRIVPPPVNADLFEAPPAGREMPHVLYAGNLDSYQNLDLLYSAMDRLRGRIPEARLCIATAEKADTPDGVIIPVPGFDALREVLREDCVFAVPRVSWSGYPIKTLNAMAAGKAIVACRSSAYPLTHEYNGLVVPDNDEKAFTDALHRLMTDHKLRAELGRNARETIVKHHNPEEVASRLSSIAEETAGIVEDTADITPEESAGE